MKWITEIEICHFKAFKETEKITIPYGKHLLIFGENGSGKTSVYNALLAILRSTEDRKTYYFEKHNWSTEHEYGRIRMRVRSSEPDPNPEEFVFHEQPSLSTNRVTSLRLANRVKGFLDYRRILRMYSLQAKRGEKENFYRPLLSSMLRYHHVASAQKGISTVSLWSEIIRIENILNNTSPTSWRHKNALEELKAFSGTIHDLLRRVVTIANEYLEKYFNKKLKIGFSVSDLKYPKYSTKRKLKIDAVFNLEVYLAGKLQEDYHFILNEARLSALSVCLYLASLKTSPVKASELRVLFLDDVFIGMDAENRMPVLEILKNEFLGFRSDQKFQLFLSTYDRPWFELVRHWFSTEKVPIEAIEMYVNDDGNLLTPDYPEIRPNVDNLKKADSLMLTRDYSTAGYLLRKECERKLKEYLPPNYMINVKGEALEELESLLNALERYFFDSGVPLPTNLVAAIRFYRKAVLNPSSHHDLVSPVFKREVLKARELVNDLCALSKIERKLLVPFGQLFEIDIPAEPYKIELELAEDLYKTEFNGTSYHSPLFFYIHGWMWKGVANGTEQSGLIQPKTKAEMDKIKIRKEPIERIIDGMSRTISVSISEDPLDLITVKGGQSINTLRNT